jgi:hypothetical protein
VDNLEFETHSNIHIKDIRAFFDGVTIDEYGFEILAHSSKSLNFTSEACVEDYKRETETLLQETFGACWVKTYDFILRKNVPFHRKTLDLKDPLHTEGPAHGAHNGTSF